MPTELEQKIIRYLEDHTMSTVATVDAENNRPHASAVEYVNDGLNIYFVSIPDTCKTKNMDANPSVALTINESYLDMRGTQGIQYYGVVSKVTDPVRHAEIQEMFFSKYIMFRMIKWDFSRAWFYEVVPQRIDFIDYRKRFGNKEIWVRDKCASKASKT